MTCPPRSFWVKPRSAMWNNMPLELPPAPAIGLATRMAQLQSGALLNVDGLAVPYDPNVGPCNMDHMAEVVATAPCMRGTAQRLGGLYTARRFYL